MAPLEVSPLRSMTDPFPVLLCACIVLSVYCRMDLYLILPSMLSTYMCIVRCIHCYLRNILRNFSFKFVHILHIYWTKFCGGTALINAEEEWNSLCSSYFAYFVFRRLHGHAALSPSHSICFLRKRGSVRLIQGNNTSLILHSVKKFCALHQRHQNAFGWKHGMLVCVVWCTPCTQNAVHLFVLVAISQWTKSIWNCRDLKISQFYTWKSVCTNAYFSL